MCNWQKFTRTQRTVVTVLLTLIVTASPLITHPVAIHARQSMEVHTGLSAERIPIFEDKLNERFENWSWNTQVAEQAGYWRVSISAGWGALRVQAREPVLNASALEFRGRGAGQTVGVIFDSGGQWSEPTLVKLPNSWQSFTVAHDGRPIDGVALQNFSGDPLADFLLDDIALVTGASPATGSPAPSSDPVRLRVDAADERGEINPHVYGISFASEQLAADLNLPINRQGGNATTRYNWKESVSNRASDWYFLNVPDEVDEKKLPDSASFNQFIQQNERTGTDSLLTLSMIGWTPNGRNFNCSFGVDKFGAQDATDPYRPNCGNGERGGEPIKNNDPRTTSQPVDERYAQEWVRYIRNRYGDEAVRFFSLDNEPMLWNQTHRDVHPEPVGYDEIRDRTYRYAAALKQSFPAAQTLGPVVWGWSAYEYSAKDIVDGTSWWENPQDRNAHGGQPFLQWYLKEMARFERERGTRILDYLDIHYYPQHAGVALSDDVSSRTQALRLRSTRSLWDPSYTDESWISEPVQLVPRMKRLIQQQYPDTKFSISEYNFGAADHINGALAQADVLGIFGREGVDMAMFWANPDANSPLAHAFRLYRNYDGRGSTFGERSLAASSSDQERVSVYAARRDDGALTIMVVNKSLAPAEIDLELAGASGGAQLYQYSEQNLGKIVRLDNRSLGGSQRIRLPQNSVQLYVLTGTDVAELPQTPPESTPEPTPTAPAPAPVQQPAQEPRDFSGVIYIDVNGNGQQDADEAGIPNALVTLRDTVGGQAHSTRTDASGRYRFDALDAAGIYVLSLALPPEFSGLDTERIVAGPVADPVEDDGGVELEKVLTESVFLPLVGSR